MTKEIQDLISEEAKKLCSTTPLDDSVVYMAYEIGATTWAERMKGFAEWTQDQNYTYLGKGVWELSELLPRFTTSELLIKYLKK